MSYVMLCCLFSPTSKICPTLWMLLRLLTSLDYTPCVSDTGKWSMVICFSTFAPVNIIFCDLLTVISFCLDHLVLITVSLLTGTSRALVPQLVRVCTRVWTGCPATLLARYIFIHPDFLLVTSTLCDRPVGSLCIFAMCYQEQILYVWNSSSLYIGLIHFPPFLNI